MQKKKIRRTLPRKASDLLELSLNDLILVEKDKGYIVDMDDWHNPGIDGSNRCRVCQAGAVLAKSMGTSPHDCTTPDYHPNHIRLKLLAINSFRVGDIAAACYKLDVENKLGEDMRKIVPYSTNKKKFKRAMRKLIRDMRKVGM